MSKENEFENDDQMDPNNWDESDFDGFGDEENEGFEAEESGFDESDFDEGLSDEADDEEMFDSDEDLELSEEDQDEDEFADGLEGDEEEFDQDIEDYEDSEDDEDEDDEAEEDDEDEDGDSEGLDESSKSSKANKNGDTKSKIILGVAAVGGLAFIGLQAKNMFFSSEGQAPIQPVQAPLVSPERPSIPAPAEPVIGEVAQPDNATISPVAAELESKEAVELKVETTENEVDDNPINAVETPPLKKEVKVTPSIPPKTEPVQVNLTENQTNQSEKALDIEKVMEEMKAVINSSIENKLSGINIATGNTDTKQIEERNELLTDLIIKLNGAVESTNEAIKHTQNSVQKIEKKVDENSQAIAGLKDLVERRKREEKPTALNYEQNPKMFDGSKKRIEGFNVISSTSGGKMSIVMTPDRDVIVLFTGEKIYVDGKTKTVTSIEESGYKVILDNKYFIDHQRVESKGKANFNFNEEKEVKVKKAESKSNGLNKAYEKDLKENHLKVDLELAKSVVVAKDQEEKIDNVEKKESNKVVERELYKDLKIAMIIGKNTYMLKTPDGNFEKVSVGDKIPKYEHLGKILGLILQENNNNMGILLIGDKYYVKN